MQALSTYLRLCGELRLLEKWTDQPDLEVCGRFVPVFPSAQLNQRELRIAPVRFYFSASFVLGACKLALTPASLILTGPERFLTLLPLPIAGTPWSLSSLALPACPAAPQSSLQPSCWGTPVPSPALLLGAGRMPLRSAVYITCCNRGIFPGCIKGFFGVLLYCCPFIRQTYTSGE